MAQEQAVETSGKLVIRNIGMMLTGALEQPIGDGDSIVAIDGRITAIGRFKDLDTEGAKTTIDAHGCVVTPGLIDSHVHPVAGDWTPRQSQMNWIESSMNGGVTAPPRRAHSHATLVSAIAGGSWPAATTTIRRSAS